MRISFIFTIVLVLFATVANADQTGPFTATIERLQIQDIGKPHNTVFLNFDITDSPCSSTNQYNRFTIVNEAQLSTLLSAVMANKMVTLYGKGTCNASDIEDLNLVILKP